MKAIFKAADFRAPGHDKKVQAGQAADVLCRLLDPIASQRLTARFLVSVDCVWLRSTPVTALPRSPVALL